MIFPENEMKRLYVLNAMHCVCLFNYALVVAYIYIYIYIYMCVCIGVVDAQVSAR